MQKKVKSSKIDRRQNDVCVKIDILPAISRQQVFEAVMTHVDDNAVVWLVSQDDISKPTKVKANV